MARFLDAGLRFVKGLVTLLLGGIAQGGRLLCLGSTSTHRRRLPGGSVYHASGSVSFCGLVSFRVSIRVGEYSSRVDRWSVSRRAAESARTGIADGVGGKRHHDPGGLG